MNGSTPLGGLRQSVTDGSSPQTMVTNTFQYRLRKKVFLVLAVIAKLWLAHGRDLFQELPAQRDAEVASSISSYSISHIRSAACYHWVTVRHSLPAMLGSLSNP